MSTFAIDVHELTKSFGTKKVVDKVSLCVEQGKIYGFLGPNGSGTLSTTFFVPKLFVSSCTSTANVLIAHPIMLIQQG